MTTCRASWAITDLFHGLASKWFEKKWIFLFNTFSFFLFFLIFAAMLKWSLKLVSCRTNTSLWVHATRHYNHESRRIRFSNFTLHRWERSETEKVSSRHSKKRIVYVYQQSSSCTYTISGQNLSTHAQFGTVLFSSEMLLPLSVFKVQWLGLSFVPLSKLLSQWCLNS